VLRLNAYVEDAKARFAAPADQLLDGEQITLMVHLTSSIAKIER
jgi:hypothetical protein